MKKIKQKKSLDEKRTSEHQLNNDNNQKINRVTHVLNLIYYHFNFGTLEDIKIN